MPIVIHMTTKNYQTITGYNYSKCNEEAPQRSSEQLQEELDVLISLTA